MPYDRFVRLQLAGDEVDPDDPVGVRRHRVQPLLPRHGRPERPGAPPPERPERHHRDDGPGLPRPDDRLRPLPRPQVRPDPAGRLLPAPGVLHPGPVPRRLPDRLGRRAGRVRGAGPAPGSAEVAAAPGGVDPRSRRPSARRSRRGPPGARRRGDRRLPEGRRPSGRPREVRLVFEALAKDRRISRRRLAARPRPGLGAAPRRPARAARRACKKAAPPPPPQARGIDEAGPTPPPTYLLRRGEFTAKGPEVAPGVPGRPLPRRGRRGLGRDRPRPQSTGRRTALADWLARPDHPLTARVIVNRLWQHHFGRGIVATPSDFGTMGEPPTHPELLDWLATELVARGWSLKAMHRLMVTSATYRQSSRRRPGRARPPTPRTRCSGGTPASGSTARRSATPCSPSRAGSTRRSAGPCVFPELPAELTKLSSKGAAWPVSDRGRGPRTGGASTSSSGATCGIPFFEAFDRPDTNASCPRRAVTTIAPQALTLLNSTLANDAAARPGRPRRAARPGPTSTRGSTAPIAWPSAARPTPSERRLAREFLAPRPVAAPPLPGAAQRQRVRLRRLTVGPRPSGGSPRDAGRSCDRGRIV